MWKVNGWQTPSDGKRVNKKELLKHPELLQILSPWTVDRLIRPIRKSEGH